GSAGKGGIGLLRLAEFLQRQALVGPALEGIAIALDHLVEVFEGSLEVAGGEIGEAAAGEGRTLARRQRNRLGEIVDRLLVLAEGLIDQAAIVKGARVGRVDLDSAIEVGESLIELTALPIDVAAADIGDVVGRAD